MNSSPIQIGITGQAGFIGSHLADAVRRDPRFRLVPSDRALFDNPRTFRGWLAECDAVVHLAGLSRHPDGAYLYQVNMALTKQLADAAAGQHILFGSTTHDAKDTPYHQSKRDGAELLRHANCHPLILRMANTFGERSRPYYNSVVSTFCAIAASGRTPDRIDDVELSLIYVGDLAAQILNLAAEDTTGTATIPHRFSLRLPDLWRKLLRLRSGSDLDGTDEFDVCLTKTYRESERAFREGV